MSHDELCENSSTCPCRQLMSSKQLYDRFTPQPACYKDIRPSWQWKLVYYTCNPPPPRVHVVPMVTMANAVRACMRYILPNVHAVFQLVCPIKPSPAADSEYWSDRHWGAAWVTPKCCQSWLPWSFHQLQYLHVDSYTQASRILGHAGACTFWRNLPTP